MPPRRRSASKVGRRPLAELGVPLAPRWLLVGCFFITFTLPNLVFSGLFFYDTLHVMKWAVTLAPLAVLGAVAGFRLLRFGTGATRFRLDGFAVVWLALLLYVTVQPLWTPPRSWVTFFREWLFFASLWLTYVLAQHGADGRLVRALLWGALVNAAINVLFAEVQVRGLNGPFFFMANVAGHYIGNTGQQNMFALWMAVTGTGGLALLLSADDRRPALTGVLVALLAVVFWGLAGSTSRSGILSLAAATIVLGAFRLRLGGRRELPAILAVTAMFFAVLGLNMAVNESRRAALLYKLEDVFERPLSLANRDSIWATSWTMFTKAPVRGVGLGQFKWNYIDAQNEMLKRWPHFKWQYTHWAHNEFLQWMAESGVFGAALMFFLWGWWMWGLFRAFFRRTELSAETLWGSALVALFFVNALWTRPFHRIENVIWLALAFAVTNREMLLEILPVPAAERFERRGRLLGGVICAVCLAGLVYLGDGLYTNRHMRAATAEELNNDEVWVMLQRVHRSPMMRDEAEKQMGYFKVSLGELNEDAVLLAEGLNDLVDFFMKQPDTKELNYLIQWAGKLGDEEFFNFVDSFVYRPSTDESGE